MVTNNTEAEQSNEERKDISLGEALAGAGTLGSLIVGMKFHNNPNLLRRLQFEYFEHMGLAAYVLVAAIMGVAFYFLAKKTRKLVERYKLLRPMMSDTGDSVLVGKTKKDATNLYLSDEDRTTHVQIIGSTGRGKTKSVILPFSSRDLKRGKSVILIDGKGSPDLMEQVFENARLSGRGHRILRFDLNDIKRSGAINPLSDGTPLQITDRLFKALTFEEPYYKTVQSNICGNLIKLIKFNEKEVSFKKLHELLTDDELLAKEISECRDEYLKMLNTKFLKKPRKERDKDVFGLVSQIAPFANGELSEIVNGDPNRWKQDSIYLSDIVTGGGYLDPGNYRDDERRPFALVISIPTLKYQESGHILGKLILQDIAGAIGYRENRENNDFLPVFLDEFSEFVYPGFVSILNKARSANVSFHLSHQSMGDLDDVSESFAKSVMTNTNVKCVLGLNDPVTADYFARHFGTFTEEKVTEQVDGVAWGEFKKTGQMSVREVESFKVSPNQLKSFNKGDGVLHLPSVRGNISEVIRFEAFSKENELGFVNDAHLEEEDCHKPAQELS